ncbi:hypothetical protein F5B18DRAFT_632537 [Nemania serpens]|nr:hypothetical protein F5B18DRAFT_632537 [Nemania serpens]
MKLPKAVAAILTFSTSVFADELTQNDTVKDAVALMTHSNSTVPIPNTPTNLPGNEVAELDHRNGSHHYPALCWRGGLRHRHWPPLNPIFCPPALVPRNAGVRHGPLDRRPRCERRCGCCLFALDASLTHFRVLGWESGAPRVTTVRNDERI